MEKVAYADHVMRYFVVLKNGEELSDTARKSLQGNLKGLYCGNQSLQKLKVGVEYLVTKTGMRTLDDQLTNQTWTIAVKPGDCG